MVLLITLEPRLSNPQLSIPTIIQNDVQKFLKQVMPNFLAHNPLFVFIWVVRVKNLKVSNF